MIPLQECYYLHARRILGDGLRHAPAALAWARGVLEDDGVSGGLVRLARAVCAERAGALSAIERERYGQLSARELSLAAWWPA